MKNWRKVAANGYLMGTFARVLGMPSPQQSPERARLRRYIEDYKAQHDLTWAEMSQAGPIPLQTLRRVRIGDEPLSRETCERVDNMLDWELGSTRAVLDGRDPTPRRRIAVEDHVLTTAIGQAAYQVLQDLDTDKTLTPEERAELDATIAERMRHDAELFIKAMRAERGDA